ncbi:putative signal transducing protein [Dokdonella sp. MW10]|uniref:putative signal transducing protein n=1 Tax=Dokdonella sp. MW10 TaxID=2992926 RepID=UPI003F7E5A81
MQIVYRAATIIDANLVKGVLEQAGIPAFVSGHYLAGAMGELQVADLVHVMVADIDVERAAPLAAEVDAALSEARDAVEDDLDGSLAPAAG